MRMRAPRSAASVALAVVATLLAGLALTTGGAFGGFTAKIANTTSSAGTAPYFSCAAAIAAQKSTALFQYALTEAAGATAATDASGNGNTGSYQGTMATSTTTPMACSRDGGSAYALNGISSYVSALPKQTNPTTFTLVVWFKTSVAGGKLIGFGSSQTGSSGSYDRHIYLNSAGNLVFGIYNGAVDTVASTATYTDGAWHQAVATLAPSGANVGMTLYVDGKQVAANTGYVTPQNFSGWWRVGYDNLAGWTGSPANAYFTGSMRYAAVYTSAFTAAQVTSIWAAGQ